MYICYVDVIVRPWKGFRDTGIVAKLLKGYWIT